MKINLTRFVVMWLLAVLVVIWYWATDPDGGAETLARLQWLAWAVVAAGPAYLLRRALMDNARSISARRKAMETSLGAGLVFIGLCILTGMLFLALVGRAMAAALPPGAVQYLPILKEEQAAHWERVPLKSALAAQVEQETCPSLKSPKCWNPRTELKTSREYGFGLGQLTITPRFDNFATARGLHPSLRDWQFAERYDPARQLRTMVLMDRQAFVRLDMVENRMERFAMTLSAYNGGLGGVQSDRRICAQVDGCDPQQWFGHVERHSLKAKVVAHGYGKSFYQINREYVRNILYVRRTKYAAWFGEA